jgi:hypothetical protein|tara:strand:+ start:54 stop:512 length:459 start_codon:yes stop_codon:yes gene_type:complete
MKQDILESIFDPEVAYESVMDVGSYNNVSFFWGSEKLLRWKLNDVRDWADDDGIIPPLEELAALSMKELEKLCDEVFEPDSYGHRDYWIGDDYEDIMNYFYWLTCNGSGYSYEMREHGRYGDDYVSVERTSLEDAKREYEFINQGIESRNQQ